MAERLPVEKTKLEYEGLFDAKAMMKVLEDWAFDKGYFLVEKRHGESTKPEGKIIDLDLEPFKKFTDYAKSIIKIRIQMQQVKDITVDRDNRKVKLQEGKIMFTFDGILETDYEHRWETKPLFYVTRTLFQKYVFSPFIGGFERGVKEDLLALKNNLKAFLNLTKYA